MASYCQAPVVTLGKHIDEKLGTPGLKRATVRPVNIVPLKVDIGQEQPQGPGHVQRAAEESQKNITRNPREAEGMRIRGQTNLLIAKTRNPQDVLVQVAVVLTYRIRPRILMNLSLPDLIPKHRI